MKLKHLNGNWYETYFKKYKIQMKKFDTSSEYGINSGKISKLWIFDIDKQETVLNYDRGWDIELDENSPVELKKLYNQIIKRYN
jgi:hypothetical protein